MGNIVEPNTVVHKQITITNSDTIPLVVEMIKVDAGNLVASIDKDVIFPKEQAIITLTLSVHKWIKRMQRTMYIYSKDNNVIVIQNIIEVKAKK